MDYRFEWDRAKAKQNVDKHGVTFEHAASVFRDPNALSVYDSGHSENEERWATLGISSTGILLVVYHTFVATSREDTIIRIISARKATRREQAIYTE